MKLLLLFCFVFVGSFVPTLTMPKVHKFEDGFVERTVAIVVRDKTAHIEYSIGLNENTLRELLADWEKSSTDETIHSIQVEPVAKPISETGQSAEKRPADSSVGGTPSSRQPVNQETKAGNSSHASQAAQPRSVQPGESATGSATETDNDDSGHDIASELLAKFEKLAPTAIAKGLNISCNGKTVDAGIGTLLPAPRHPFTIALKFQFEFPNSDACTLKFSDQNFLQQSGAVRYSLKATGDAMLLRSDVAPIIIRAERVEISKLSSRIRTSATSINARLGFVPSTKK